MDFDLNLRNLQENNEFYEKMTQENAFANSIETKYSNLSVLVNMGHSEFIDEELFQHPVLSTSKNVDFLMFDTTKPEEKNTNLRKTSISSVDDSHILVEFKVASKEIHIRNFDSCESGKKEALF